MKTINEGKIPDPKPWWVGKKITCSHCKYEGEFEESDEPDSYTEKKPNGKSWVEINCPTCRHAVILHKPERTPFERVPLQKGE